MLGTEGGDNLIPGPEIILACPSCRQPQKDTSYLSGNTARGDHWSDGFVSAPMAPWVGQPPVAKCPSCAHCFLVWTAEELGSIDPYDRGSSARQYESAPSIVRVGDEEAIFAFIDGASRLTTEADI